MVSQNNDIVSGNFTNPSRFSALLASRQVVLFVAGILLLIILFAGVSYALFIRPQPHHTVAVTARQDHPSSEISTSHTAKPTGSSTSDNKSSSTPGSTGVSAPTNVKKTTPQVHSAGSKPSGTSGTSSSAGTNNSSGSGSSNSGGGGGSTPSGPGCTSNVTVAPCVGSATTGASGWGSPTFDDEFNGTSLNTTFWDPRDGWTNQNSVTTYASNITVSGGNAILTLASSSSGAEMGTSSYGLPVGGFVEARVEFPGNGTDIYNWPAWWISGPSWPAAGESDIAEGLGTLTVNYHSSSGAHNQGTIPGTWSNAFHTYGVYRGSNYCDVYWDGTLVKTYSTDDNGQPETLILTAGAGNTAAYGSASQVKVDYVRAWE